jgi:hypothetical protein
MIVSKIKAWKIFDHWFFTEGHWLFGVNGKDKAIEAWKKWGIIGLPEYPGELN